MLAHPATNVATAIALVGTDPVRAPAGAPRPWARHAPVAQQRLKHQTFVTMARLEDKVDGLTRAIGVDAQFGRESALAAAERFGRWVPFFAPAAC